MKVEIELGQREKSHGSPLGAVHVCLCMKVARGRVLECERVAHLQPEEARGANQTPESRGTNLIRTSVKKHLTSEIGSS